MCVCSPWIFARVDTGMTSFLWFFFFLVFLHRYVAQLYRRISKIEWDYECEPGMIKGSILCGECETPGTAGED